MTRGTVPAGIEDQLDTWCGRHLGALPTRTLFCAGNLSVVVGLALADGRRVVVKVRPPAERLAACVAVQHHLARAGFPCPEPLAGPVSLGELMATAETYVPGGTLLRGGRAPDRFAAALAGLLRLAPSPGELSSLQPPPCWLYYDHTGAGVWPVPASTRADLNAQPGPGWLDELARRTRTRLRRCEAPLVIGHADFESQNVRWSGARLHAVHDWDSVAALPEPVIVGAAAAAYPATGRVAQLATLAATQQFLTCYARHRGRPWSDDEQEVAWASGLWVCAYNARVEVAEDRDDLAQRLLAEGDRRLALAGA